MKSLIFTNYHVELILSGRKTETRRLVKDPAKPPFQPGDLVWVREAFWREYSLSGPTSRVSFTNPSIWPSACLHPSRWRKMSPIFIRRADSRLTIEVTGCRLERMLDITAGAPMREGYDSVSEYFAEWDRLNPKTPAYADPLVWVIAFRRSDRDTHLLPQASFRRDRRLRGSKG